MDGWICLLYYDGTGKGVERQLQMDSQPAIGRCHALPLTKLRIDFETADT